MVDEADKPEVSENADGEDRKRERSRVEFPYTDLQTASELSSRVLSSGGGSCTEDQLAAWLNQSSSGGTFRSRLSAARMFGLIETQSRNVTLTELGHRVTDRGSSAAALAEAFLEVSLYALIYEKLKGFALPPAAAIERQMIAAGVVKTQSDRARQAFVKSATFAGFIDAANGRFVRPGNATIAAPEEVAAKQKGGGGGGGSDDGDLHPFIQGLLETLPPPATEWKIEDRVKWLSTAASIFGLIYKGDGSIKVEDDTL